jgi:hypothetical protein
MQAIDRFLGPGPRHAILGLGNEIDCKILTDKNLVRILNEDIYMATPLEIVSNNVPDLPSDMRGYIAAIKDIRESLSQFKLDKVYCMVHAQTIDGMFNQIYSISPKMNMLVSCDGGLSSTNGCQAQAIKSKTSWKEHERDIKLHVATTYLLTSHDELRARQKNMLNVNGYLVQKLMLPIYQAADVALKQYFV